MDVDWPERRAEEADHRGCVRYFLCDIRSATLLGAGSVSRVVGEYRQERARGVGRAKHEVADFWGALPVRASPIVGGTEAVDHPIRKR